jgi:hypothetical protein
LTNSPDPAQAVQGRPKPSASKKQTAQLGRIRGFEIAQILSTRKQGCQIESVSIQFDFRSRRCRNLSIQFDSKYDLIRYETAAAVMKENWPSGKWSISKEFFTIKV